jgi:predicted phage terminase large subunit-like protein
VQDLATVGCAHPRLELHGATFQSLSDAEFACQHHFDCKDERIVATRLCGLCLVRSSQACCAVAANELRVLHQCPIDFPRNPDRRNAWDLLVRGGYELLCLPAEFELDRRCATSIGWTDPRTEPGQLLWPERISQADLDHLKLTLGSYRYAGQYQQRPAPAGGGMLKAHWWRYWQPPGANLPPVPVKLLDGTLEQREAVDLPQHFEQQIQSWDMAFKDTKKSDYVVGQVHAALGADRYILDQVRARMDLPATLLSVRRLSAHWPNAALKLVEDKANGPSVVQSLRHEIAGFVEVNPEGGKVSRAAAASPHLESGNWYLPHPMLAPWVAEFIGECSAFPAGAHDDQVDAWSQGAKRLIHIKPEPPAPPRRRRDPYGDRPSEHAWML